MSAVDVLIFIPLIPAIPVLATWVLPWEDWIPRKVPKKVLAPYLLYCTFAVWHFGLPWWSVASVAFLAIGSSAMLLSELRKARRLKEARHWPTAEARILHVGRRREDKRTVNVTLTYTYRVHGEFYAGCDTFTFVKDEDAARFEEAHREGAITVHYRPDKPEISVFAPEDSAIVEKSPSHKLPFG